ncbi:hypothetical protein M3603_14575 [Rummeliibacillus stabekisii]|uniref:Uncharacterized protein n=1 Tax=Rummeliibacillus stabekisii TaxID=241244 RepID=A0A143HG85_9BACL|nr:hypothetical protein [Rummeliibacillus stabekisii]AMX00262.1 hypothetical protein ATY39_13095 [Rummeliibacillus stabekisii]MCM3317847.1 hypothetical protein [Rummeliibacillus stabekisii]
MAQEITIQLQDEEMTQLNAKAKEQGLPLEEYVRRLVENNLLEEKQSNPSVSGRSDGDQIEIAANEAVSSEGKRRQALSNENDVKFNEYSSTDGRTNP